MNRSGPLPWALTFSYGRALQDDRAQGLGRRGGQLRAPARRSSAKRAKLNGLATTGRYTADDGEPGRLRHGGAASRVTSPAPPQSCVAGARPTTRWSRCATCTTPSTAAPIFAGLDHHGAPRPHHRRHGAERHRQDDAAAPDHRHRSAPTAARCGCSARTSATLGGRGDLRAAPAHGHAVPERRAAHRHRRVRERRLPGARAHRSARAADPHAGAHQAAGGRPARRRAS